MAFLTGFAILHDPVKKAALLAARRWARQDSITAGNTVT
jgi:hypothetical protein